MNYECSDKGTHTQNIHNSSTPSHAKKIALEIAARIAGVKGLKSSFPFIRGVKLAVTCSSNHSQCSTVYFYFEAFTASLNGKEP
jgi:hypothetical protein